MTDMMNIAIPEETWQDYIPVSIVALLGIAYLLLFLGLRRRRRNISYWHLGSFVIGISILAMGMAPPMMHWGHDDIRGHMVQHLLIAMYAPIFLVLGVPLKLLLLSVPPSVARNMTIFLKSRAIHVLSHPFTALLLSVGGMYILYLTPLYQLSLGSPFLHGVVHVHFVLAGCLFAWSVIGLEALPNRPDLYVRLAVIFLSIALHGCLCKIMYVYALPDITNTAGGIAAATCKTYSGVMTGVDEGMVAAGQEAAVMMYYWGDLAELILLVIVFTLWFFRKQPNVRLRTVFPG